MRGQRVNIVFGDADVWTWSRLLFLGGLRCGDVINIVVSWWLAFKATVCYRRWAVATLLQFPIKEEGVQWYCVKCETCVGSVGGWWGAPPLPSLSPCIRGEARVNEQTALGLLLAHCPDLALNRIPSFRYPRQQGSLLCPKNLAVWRFNQEEK